MTITDFLLARIAMDKVVWREMSKHDAAIGMPGLGERLLRECEAKRRIVETFPIPFIADPPDGVELSDVAQVAVDVLRALAAVYVDHPDYDSKWRLL